MPNMVDLYTPRTLAEVVKTTPPVRTFLRDRFFTNVKTFPTKRVDIDIVMATARWLPLSTRWLAARSCRPRATRPRAMPRP